jgi:DNA-binding response OmpR family regulator
MDRILLIEDDQSLGFLIQDNLENNGYEVKWIQHGKDAENVQVDNFDICLIDVMLPGMDGFTLTEKIREENEYIPILFITARSKEEDRLRGFAIGGDDYITKPFSVKELLYRISVFIRRTKAQQQLKTESWRQVGVFSFSQDHLLLKSGDLSINLTQKEADLLNMLLKSSGQVVKRKDILEQIWGEDDYFKGRSLDVFISRLRKYLKSDNNLEIRNHHGVGFSLITLS